MVVQSREGASSPAPDIGFARQLIRDKAENFANIRHYKDALGQLVTLYDALNRKNADLSTKQTELEAQTKIAKSNLALAEANAEALEEALKRKPSTAAGKSTPEMPQAGFFATALGTDFRSITPDPDKERSLPFWKRKRPNAAPTPPPVSSPESAFLPLNPPSIVSLSDNRSSVGSSTAVSTVSSNFNSHTSVDSLRNQLQSLAATHSNAVSRLQTTSEAHEKLRTEHATLQQDHDTTLQHYGELQDAHTNLKAELEALSVDLFEEANQMVASERKARAEEVQQLEVELTTLRQQLEDRDAYPSSHQFTDAPRAQSPSESDSTKPALSLQVPTESSSLPTNPVGENKSPTTLNMARSWFSNALGRKNSDEPITTSTPPIPSTSAFPPESPRCDDRKSIPSHTSNSSRTHRERAGSAVSKPPSGDSSQSRTSTASQQVGSDVHPLGSDGRPDSSKFLSHNSWRESPQLNRSHFSNDTPSGSPVVSTNSLRLKSSTSSSAAVASHPALERPHVPELPTIGASQSSRSIGSVQRWQDRMLEEAENDVKSANGRRRWPRDESFDSLPSVDSDRSVDTIEWDDEDGDEILASLEEQLRQSRTKSELASSKRSSSKSSRRKSVQSLADRHGQLKNNELFRQVTSNPKSRFSARFDGLKIYEDNSVEPPIPSAPLSGGSNRSGNSRMSRGSNSKNDASSDTEGQRAVANVLNGRFSMDPSPQQTDSRDSLESNRSDSPTDPNSPNTPQICRSTMARAGESSFSLSTSATSSSLGSTLAQMPDPPQQRPEFKHRALSERPETPTTTEKSLRSARSLSSLQGRSQHDNRLSRESNSLPSSRSINRLAGEGLPDVPPLPSSARSGESETTPTLGHTETFESPPVSGRSTPVSRSAPAFPSSLSQPPRPKNFMDRWQAEAGRKVANGDNQVWARGRRTPQQQHQQQQQQHVGSRSAHRPKAPSEASQMSRDNSSLDTLMRSIADDLDFEDEMAMRG